jgi:hypothetical protein
VEREYDQAREHEFDDRGGMANLEETGPLEEGADGWLECGGSVGPGKPKLGFALTGEFSLGNSQRGGLRAKLWVEGVSFTLLESAAVGRGSLWSAG